MTDRISLGTPYDDDRCRRAGLPLGTAPEIVSEKIGELVAKHEYAPDKDNILRSKPQAK